MSDNQLIEDALAVMVRKAGVRVQKDDPILLNALVIQMLFQEQADLARRMSDEMIRAGESNFETSITKFSGILAENAKAHQANSGIFLESLREILANQSKQKYDMEPLAARLSESLKNRFIAFGVFQTLLIIVLAATIIMLQR